MENLSFMLAPLLSSKLILVLIFGTLFGLILGVLPGLGPTTGGALILPFTMWGMITRRMCWGLVIYLMKKVLLCARCVCIGIPRW